MVAQLAPPTDTAIERVLTEFVEGIVGAIPNVLSGILFLVLASVVIKVVLAVARSLLDRVYPESEELVVDLLVVVIGLFLWFGAALALLKILGLDDVAASLGTASGFIGLGIAFALKEMIADTVAGVYLLRDPDFSAGDRVETASVTGTVTDIDLRKTRIRDDDGDLIVLANREVEKRWALEADNAGEEEETADTT